MSHQDGDMHTDSEASPTLTRRNALQAVLGAGILLTASGMLPRSWQTPRIHVGALPAHAQTSGTTGGDNGGAANTGGGNSSGGSNSNGGEPTDEDAGGSVEGSSQWSIAKTIESDPCGHDPFIGLGSVLTVKITGTSIELRATGMPTMSGTIDENGTFSAGGMGTVAGVANVTASIEGTLAGNTLEATLSLGEGGELPLGNCQTAMPITYALVCTKS